MSLYKAGETWGVDYRDEFGRRHRKAVGSEEAARTLDNHIRQETRQAKRAVRTFQASETLQTSEAAEIWIATLPVGQIRKDKVQKTLAQAIRLLGNPQVSQVTPKLLSQYAELRKTQLAPSTQAHENGTLKAFFRWLADQWYLPSNPAAALPTKAPRQSPGLAISYADEAEILNACRTHNTRTKVLLAIDAGLRISEIARLRTEHWNQAEQTLTVFSTKNRTTRIIPTTRRLQAELQDVKQTPGSNLIHSRGQTECATDFLRKAKRPGAKPRFHDLRHTFASRLAAVSKPHVVRQLMGHAPRSTTDYYIHPSIEELREAVAAMEAQNPNTQSMPLRSAQQPQEQQAKPTPERKEPTTMPGKRYSFRLEGTRYGPLDRQRVRVADDQSSNQPGQVTVEAAGFEGKFVVALQDMHPIQQPTTLPKEEEQ